ncbi:hypothetical protein B1964_07845 [Gordonia sp. i37]|nr:hypothetical protein B1964_07845 [Gordonia sp. i37]
MFLVLLSALRPRIRIAPTIAKTPTASGEHDYRIKFINCSRRSCVDLTIRAFIVREWKVPATDHETGVVRALHALDVNRAGVYVPGRRRKDNQNRHAQRVKVSSEHIDAWVDSDQTKYMLVRIVARDGVSGFPKAFEQKFELSSQVQVGTFRTGDSLEVTEWTAAPKKSAETPN